MNYYFLSLLLILSIPLTSASNLKKISEAQENVAFKKLSLEILKSANWYTVAASKTNLSFFNANEVNVDKEKSVVTALVRRAPKADLEKGELITYEDYLEMHDCLNNTVKALAFDEYKDNKLVKSKAWDYPPEPVAKGSVGEQIHIEACEYLDLIE